MKVKIATSVVLLSPAISLAWLLLQLPPGYRSTAVIATAVGFLLASAALFLKPRIGYGLGLLSGLVAVHWFWEIEFSYFPALNSWVAFNLSHDNPDFLSDIYVAKLKILFATTVVTAISCSIIRFLPANWTLRNTPLRERTWPALAVCTVVIAWWYLASASPYRIPMIVDAVPPEVSLLHVEKRGSQFHEVGVTVYRDRRFYVEENARRLFQYSFAARWTSGVLPAEIASRVKALAESNQLLDIRTRPAIVLRRRNSEGWYVRIGRATVLAFTTEYGTKPPPEVADLFNHLGGVPSGESGVRTVSDVCLGFCYDPLAGLGIVNMNDRCTEQNGTQCR